VKTEIIKQGLNWLIISSIDDALVTETKEVLKGVYDFNFAPFTTASGEHTVQNYLTNPEWCKDPLHHKPWGWDSLQEKFKTHTQRELVNYGLMNWTSMKVHSAWSVAGDQGSYQTIHQHGLGHICTVTYLDVPEEDSGQLIDWGNRMIGFDDPEHADVLINDPESEKYRLVPFRSPAALEVFAYGDELARQRKGKDGVDLVSVLVNSPMSDGIALSERDFHTNFLLLVVAGNETTRHTITHTMNNLINNPDQLALLQERPDLIPWAVEEFLRYASPVYHFRRTATKDVEFNGVQIKQGQKLVPWFASGNRDDSVFENPNKFDVTRNPNEHMSFGRGGPHMCLGNALARIELRVMFEDLINRVDKVERTGEVDFLRSNFVHGIKRMPVIVTLR
jgi:hypothetical protein